jgi:hypothetical protein
MFKKLKAEVIKYLCLQVSSDEQRNLIKEKFNNLTNKTGKYNVPDELFQGRTSRKNRVLISWKSVKNNKLTYNQLKSFSGGVVVEFINEDFFNHFNNKNKLFKLLKTKLGSDEVVSSMISFRTENGDPSSFQARKYYCDFIKGTQLTYKEKKIFINSDNVSKYFLKRLQSFTKDKSIGNEKWEGFLFISIRGGQQDSIFSHNGLKTRLFNPACEYLNEEVSRDLIISMSYFAMFSIPLFDRGDKFNKLISKLSNYLESAHYKNNNYEGNLLDYCNNHYSIKYGKIEKNNQLYDPIEIEKLSISDFSIKDKSSIFNIDLSHNESMNKDNYYWDKIKNCILSPSRPTNVFWSKHFSNMIQQNLTIDEFYEKENSRFIRRKHLQKNRNN